MFSKFLYFLGFILLLSALGAFVYDGLGSDLLSLKDSASLSEIRDALNSPPPLRGGFNDLDSFLTRTGVIFWTNVQRENQNLDALSENSKLNRAAEAKLVDMSVNNYFEHVSPGGLDAADFVDQAEYKYVVLGENLASGNFRNDETVVKAWMDSPGHRANILQSRYTEIGAAVKQVKFEGRDTWMAVQVFALPLEACPPIDNKLRDEINLRRSNISSIKEELSQLKNDIENYHPKKGDEYDALIERYNSMVADANKLIVETEVLINQYNGEVEALNNCINSQF